jgi:magnesium-transporting ATPase (P-type)
MVNRDQNVHLSQKICQFSKLIVLNSEPRTSFVNWSIICIFIIIIFIFLFTFCYVTLTLVLVTNIVRNNEKKPNFIPFFEGGHTCNHINKFTLFDRMFFRHRNLKILSGVTIRSTAPRFFTVKYYPHYILIGFQKFGRTVPVFFKS